MPSASSYLRSLDSGGQANPQNTDYANLLRGQRSSPESNYQSPRIELQHGSPRTQSLLNQSDSPRNQYAALNNNQSSLAQYKLSQQVNGQQRGSPRGEPDDPSPLIRRSGDSTHNYTNLLKSSLDQRSPVEAGNKQSYGYGVSLDQGRPTSDLRGSFQNDRLGKQQSPSNSIEKQLYSADRYNQQRSPGERDRPTSKESDPLSDLSAYRKNLLSDYGSRLSESNPSSSSRLIQEHDQKVRTAQKPSHHRTPQATDTYTATRDTPSHQTPRADQLKNDNPHYKPSPRQPNGDKPHLSVFNYEGGDRTQSRNQLHMLMNHNLMNAHGSSNQDDGQKKKNNMKKSRKRITVNLQGTRYEIVREVVEKLGYSVTRDDDSLAYLLWNDTFVSTERISEMKSFQRINHFPGMGEICRKDCLARNMAKMVRAHPDEYNFIPKTWILPQEYNSLQNYAKDLKKKKKMKIFIAKPSNGAMGNGISLYHNAEKIPPSEHFVIQEYLERPFLIDDFKCDLRIYVLCSSCDPLKLFLFNDGLLRISTEKYKDPSPQNLDVLFMHLTNYSINKHSETYEKGHSVESGSKRSLKFLNEYMRRNDVDVSTLWANITDVIVKTMICALPHVHHAYKMCRPGATPNSDSVCFEILGFDIMLDRKLKPWLLEINRSPSFGTNEQIDYDIKSALLTDSLKIVNIRASDKKKTQAAQKAAAQKRLLQPRGGGPNNTGEDTKKSSNDKRKEELKDLLARIRKENAKTDFEDRNCGRFRRIFPPQDRYQQERYAKLLLSAFNNLVVGKNASMAREIERQYLKKYREDEVLDMLAQYEAEDAVSEGRARKPRGPPPLTAMPCSTSQPNQQGSDDSESDSDEEEEREPRPQRPTRTQSVRPMSSGPQSRNRTPSRPRSGVRQRGASPANNLIRCSLAEDTAAVNKAIKEKEEELVGIVLSSLQEMRIKFPGKSDTEAEHVLDKIIEDWKFHKPRVASYWLVKLDSIKRRKVIDIVRSNVKAKIQHIYQTHDVDGLRIFRVFSRVFNRLLWSHGQGLWNCFSGNSWETIFSKSTDIISETEMECCRRITQLCKDCLLIVYQFASEAKNKQQNENEVGRLEQNESQPPPHPNRTTNHPPHRQNGYAHHQARYSRAHPAPSPGYRNG